MEVLVLCKFCCNCGPPFRAATSHQTHFLNKEFKQQKPWSCLFFVAVGFAATLVTETYSRSSGSKVATLWHSHSKGNVLPELRLESRNFVSTAVVKDTFSRSSGSKVATCSTTVLKETYPRIPLIGLDLSTGGKIPTFRIGLVYWPILKVVFSDLGFLRTLFFGGGIMETYE